MRFSIDAAALASATHGPILSSLIKLSNRTPAQWFPPGHAAIRGELPAKWNALRLIPVSDAIDAVALSAPQHCMDGWAYVSRALGALLSGGIYTAARHLAYYSQLRAGLSILANVGIGIFNGVNFAIISPTALRRIDYERSGLRTNKGMGTHSADLETLLT